MHCAFFSFFSSNCCCCATVKAWWLVLNPRTPLNSFKYYRHTVYIIVVVSTALSLAVLVVFWPFTRRFGASCVRVVCVLALASHPHNDRQHNQASVLIRRSKLHPPFPVSCAAGSRAAAAAALMPPPTASNMQPPVAPSPMRSHTNTDEMFHAPKAAPRADVEHASAS